MGDPASGDTDTEREAAAPVGDAATMAADPPAERWMQLTVPHAPAAPRARSPEESAPASAPLAAGRFEEREELGRGGMGRVYAAFDRLLNRTVAVKQALSSDAGIAVRFEREIQIAARLQHPNLVPILDAGRDARGRPFYVMRKIEGKPLDQLLHGADLRTRLGLLANVASVVDAVAYAHAQGVIHRDIKPSNILVGEFGESLLIDWGIARMVDEQAEAPVPVVPTGDLTAAGSALGTPGYMPPEQARGEVAGRSADVYALGATLYQVLGGRRPFEGIPPTEAIARVAAGEAPSFELPDGVPADLVAIVKKAMAVDVATRYPDGRALATDLRAFLAGKLVGAHAYSAREHVVRWLRRHRVAVLLGLAAFVAVVIVSAVAVRNVLSARHREALAREQTDAAIRDSLASLALRDPDGVLATLNTLPPSSPLWRGATGTVTTAIHAGARRTLAIGTPYGDPLAVSPNGELAIIANHWTEIAIVDASLARPPVRIPLDADVSGVIWTDGGRSLLVATKQHTLLAIDRATLRSRAVPIPPCESLTLVPSLADASGPPMIVADGTLMGLDATPKATGVKEAARVRDGVAYRTDEGLFVDTTRVAEKASFFVVHPDGRRIAYHDGGGAIDVAWSAGRLGPPTRCTGAAEQFDYSGDQLVVSNGTELRACDASWRVTLRAPVRSLAAGPKLVASTRHSLAVVTPAGALVERGAPPLDLGGLRLVDGRIVGADRPGVLSSWPLAPLVASRLPEFPRLVGQQDDRVVIASGEVLFELTATGELRPLGAYSFGAPWVGCAADDGWLELGLDKDGPGFRLRMVGREGGPSYRANNVAYCDDRVVAVWTDDAVELRARDDLERVLTRVPAEGATRVAVTATHVAVLGRDHLTVSDTRGTVVRSTAVGPVSAFLLKADGSTITALDHDLVRPAGGTLRLPFTALQLDHVGRDVIAAGSSTNSPTNLDLVVTIAPDGTLRRYTTNGQAPQVVGTRFLVIQPDQTAIVTDAESHVVMRFDVRDTTQVALAEHHLIAVSGSSVRRIPLDLVPSDPDALRAFVKAWTDQSP